MASRVVQAETVHRGGVEYKKGDVVDDLSLAEAQTWDTFGISQKPDFSKMKKEDLEEAAREAGIPVEGSTTALRTALEDTPAAKGK